MSRLLIGALLGALAVASTTAAEPPEFARGRGSQGSWAVVNTWYQRFLRRAPDATSVSWSQALDRGGNPEKLLASILSSDEYYRLAGSTPRGYVQTLFRDLNGRDPSRDEFIPWMRRLALSAGEAPSFEERTDVAYAMLLRYPQNWLAAPPPPPDIDRDRRDPDRDRPDVDREREQREREQRERERREHNRDEEYDYRRPVYPGYHRDDHDDHRDEHRDRPDRNP